MICNLSIPIPFKNKENKPRKNHAIIPHTDISKQLSTMLDVCGSSVFAGQDYYNRVYIPT